MLQVYASLDNARKPAFIADFMKNKKNPQFAMPYTDEVVNTEASSSTYNISMLLRNCALYGSTC